MEFTSIILTTLTVVWSVHSLKLDPLGRYIEGLQPGNDVPHPMDVSSSRHVREAEKPRHHRSHGGFIAFEYCCGGENNTEFKKDTEEPIEALQKCVDELKEEDEWTMYGNPTKDPFSCETSKKFKDQFNCFFNCMMRVRGLLREDGTDDIEKWEVFVSERLAFPWLKELALVALNKCIDNKDYSWIQNGDKLKCNPRALDINHCLWKEIVVTCPEEHFVKNAYCKRVKESLKEFEG
ncbi:unnamed protein product [Nezara viridula]|uniref:Uncharacterized protein n=1 Tax=Nezara viridula TaxID=85310 RepID=A0A9P0MXV6_NEZVI|nr:unnamed protein product [Nezara viridula]